MTRPASQRRRIGGTVAALSISVAAPSSVAVYGVLASDLWANIMTVSVLEWQRLHAGGARLELPGRPVRRLRISLPEGAPIQPGSLGVIAVLPGGDRVAVRPGRRASHAGATLSASKPEGLSFTLLAEVPENGTQLWLVLSSAESAELLALYTAGGVEVTVAAADREPFTVTLGSSAAKLLLPDS